MPEPKAYLGLKARISQAWLAPPLVFLVVFMVKLALLNSFISATLNTAERLFVLECKSLGDLSVVFSQIPQESIKLANELVNASINHGIRSFMHGLSLSLTAIEELIYFALEMTTGTYACFTISAVNIGANEALNATEFVVKEANKTAGAIGRELNDGLGKLSGFINGAIGLIDSVEDFISGGDSYLHSVNLTVSKLDDLNISSNINAKLESLRRDIPTYEGTTEAVRSLIAKPFNFIKTSIDNQNVSLDLKLANPNSTATNPDWRCDTAEVQKAFNAIHKSVSHLVIAFCVLCVLAVICGTIWNVYKAKSHWKRLVAAASVSAAPATCANKNPFFDHSEKAQQPSIEDSLTAITTQLEFGWLERHIQRQLLPEYWWPLHYCLSRPIVSFLGIGAAGLAISVLEVIVISEFRHGTRFLAELEREVRTGFSGNTAMMYGIWCNQTNSQISTVESQINNQLLGWVHQGSKGINQSIAAFVNHINNEISSTFDGTALLAPIQAVANCAFENKARDIEKGLTWVFDNSQVALPRVRESLFSTRNASQMGTSKQAKQAEMVVESALRSLNHEIKIQILCSGLFIALWVTFAIGACLFRPRSTTPFCKEDLMTPDKWLPKPPTGIKRDNRPSLLMNIPISEPVGARSPIERISDRVTQFFGGPARRVSFRNVGSPRQATISKAETPRTPLRAMIINS